MSSDWTNNAVVALGSNLGDSAGLVREAIEKLRTLSAEPLLVSSLWQSTPVDCPPGSPLFINAVAAFKPLTDETPETLLAKLQALEKEFGRQPKKIVNEARPLDLDLITFGQEQCHTPTLQLPHPRASHRRFVLQPLAEILPGFQFPHSQASVEQLLAALETDESLRRIADQ